MARYELQNGEDQREMRGDIKGLRTEVGKLTGFSDHAGAGCSGRYWPVPRMPSRMTMIGFRFRWQKGPLPGFQSDRWGEEDM